VALAIEQLRALSIKGLFGLTEGEEVRGEILKEGD
jgi:hypothetical protein